MEDILTQLLEDIAATSDEMLDHAQDQGMPFEPDDWQHEHLWEAKRLLIAVKEDL